ncbi:MAG: sulfatase [Gemmataceae bacterium]
MNRVSALIALACSFLLIPTQTQAGTAKPKPMNVLFVLVDDLGWSDLGCYGNKFNETPNIDKLANQGMRFTDFYAAGAVCSPTRASILSGQYQARFGLTAHIPGHWRPFEKVVEPPCALDMPLSVVTIAEALKTAGYRTGHIGKWHLGGAGHQPKDQGFDFSIVTSGRHDARRFRTSPKRKIPKDKRLAEFLTDEAVGFLKRNKDQPFFLHLSHYAVHIPLSTTPELLKKYENKSKVEGYPCNPKYAGLLEEVDRSVGRLMKALDDLGLAENTLVVVTSDNGGLIMRYDGGEIVCNNLPLRSEKGSLYEGGIRVPLIIRCPGIPIPGGKTSSVPTISIDFYPTFLDAANAKRPKKHILDGRSLIPLLKNPKAEWDRPIFFHYPHYHHSRPSGAVRLGDWTAIEFFDTGELELYNLKTDIGQKKNLVRSKPMEAQRLRKLMQRFRDEVNAQMPQRNPAYNPKRAGEWWSRRRMAPIPKRQ